ncbi:MAG: acetate kinase [Lentimicrobiaceae bacterium]|jgi:acetate kinase|nr:acetate kinase [Lentimicrobiaceae bacterium]MBT3454853.1 acetate kinase [Lentimicrobiaceae bacterium]MBT3818521.1 acetate kinase [Lentimicrobiaceae bacterium]MBT4060888.1 acetate kinase [Lentimicrobiaceae bacterium]MBT4190561.1 acetate kinase [Lentimicrobiaceae bacterium]
MKVIVLNCGSSSIKYQLFDMPSTKVIAKGLVDKIGLKGSAIKHKRDGCDSIFLDGEILDHQQGIEYLLGILISKKYGSISTLNDIQAVGHRVVHGAEDFSGSVLITDEVIKALEDSSELAPLHNPPNLKGIFAMQQLLPDVKQVGVFDTAFHQTMPDYSYLYAIPYVLYEKYKIRRYGFHGTSHKYVSLRACEVLDVDISSQKIITCHLGNGSSVAAIKNGKSIDTSMGMTPTEGLMMGTRTGDIDPGALLYVAGKEGTSLSYTSTLINKFSGLLGISGVSSDMRDIEEASKKGNKRADLALEMFAYRVKKYIGAYAAALGGVDIIVFTGGIGERDPDTRIKILTGLDFMGVDIDMKNAYIRGEEVSLSSDKSKVKVLVVPTDEELMIARDTYQIVS